MKRRTCLCAHFYGHYRRMRRAVSGELLVGVRGFEPPAPASRKRCSTRLSYTPPTEGEI
jgi:hypothetical protein